MILALLMALQALAEPPTLGGADPGRCGWEHVPAVVRSDFLDAYARNMGTGMSVLQAHDAELMGALSACLPLKVRAAPAPLRQALAAAAAIRAGAVAELAKGGGPDRETLERQWREAPAAARTCARANAGKVFGQTLACPDPKAFLAFLTAAKIDPVTSRERAAQLLYFMNATAQTEWALALLDGGERR